MEKVHDMFRERLIKAAGRQKRRYNLTSTPHKYKANEGVMLKDRQSMKGEA